MKTRIAPKRILLTVAAAALGIGAGAGVASASGLIFAQPADSETAEAPEYAVSDSGLSYGSLADAPSDALAPDLILVELPDGQQGYVYSEELFAAENDDPSSPGEAIASNDKGPVGVPVYELDGVTRIGTFWVGQGQ